MSTVITPQATELRSRVEDFLYAEAALLDDWRLDEWLSLLTPDARYEVPSTDRPGGRPDTALMLISDSRAMINARVKRLNSRKAYREFPWSRTRRIVGNVRVLAIAESGELEVTANFAVYRTRNGHTNCYAGRYLYRLVPDGEAFLIDFRRAELDQETLDEHGTLSIILLRGLDESTVDRRLTKNAEPLRFRVDATRCDGQGVCALIAPELFALDRYGLAYVIPGSQEIGDADPDVRARGLEADALCPRNAIREDPAPPARPAPAEGGADEEHGTLRSRLLLAAPESVAGWRERGGWASRDGGALIGTGLIDLVERAGIRGQGGAAFPAAAKWRRVAGAARPIVLVNAAEREPGTIKDRYLIGSRPGLVLDGLRLAMRAVGATEAVVAVDEDSTAEHDALTAAIAEATGLGLLDGCEVRVHKVPARYVAGEETALIALLNGGPALPRLRPPFPSDTGVSGRPTLVQNVETLAQVALAAALGAQEFRAAGVPESPGTGLFSIGPFGGPYHLAERPYGYQLRALLAESGLLGGARAVLVGGYAGGLLSPDAFGVALAPAPLAAAGAALGTKSVQVIGDGHCPVRVAAEIVGYFGAESAGQCPPCSRGLPDMAALLRDLEAGTGGQQAVDDLASFMATLPGRGVCRLPDGAARVAMSLLSAFRDEVDAHATAGCPLR